MVASISPGTGPASAEITVTGQRVGGDKPFVEVNGERAFTGRTFFSDGVVSTNETNSATVNLGKLGRIELAPSSSMSLSFSEGRISGLLSKGNVIVTNMDGVAVTIDTPNDSVTNEGNAPSRFTVGVVGDQTRVAVENGTVRAKSGATMTAKQDDDDDDDDDWKVWAAIGLVAAAVVIVVILIQDDEDDDTVSPIR